MKPAGAREPVEEKMVWRDRQSETVFKQNKVRAYHRMSRRFKAVSGKKAFLFGSVAAQKADEKSSGLLLSAFF